MVTNSSGDKIASWAWYTIDNTNVIWDAPAAIPEVCYGENDLDDLGEACGPQGENSEWNAHMRIADHGYSDAPIFDDLYNCTKPLPAISWVIPDWAWSDHPPDGGSAATKVYGPDWVGDIVDAVGEACNRKYWISEPTAIFVTWDDWGGWFDHVPPFKALQQHHHPGYTECDPATQWGCGYTYGFRVPLLVVSPYTGTPTQNGYTGYVSGACGGPGQPICPNNVSPYVHDFGSILAFTKKNFNLPFIDLPDKGYADYNAPDWSSDHQTYVPLSDFFPLPVSQPRPFTHINTAKDYTSGLLPSDRVSAHGSRHVLRRGFGVCAAARGKNWPGSRSDCSKPWYILRQRTALPDAPLLAGRFGSQTSRCQMRSRAWKTTLAQLVAMATTAAILLPAAWGGSRYKVLHNFGSGKDGSVPSGPLFLDNSGNLYGVTGGGPGQYGYGVAFELMPQTNGKWKEAILYSFASADGSPWGAFIWDRAGNLYGTTVAGGGVFELSPVTNGWNFSVLYAHGAGPGLLMGKSGNLYGAIGPGDYFGAGAIGELSPGLRPDDGWVYTQLFSFDPTVGYAPPAPPIWDGKGHMLGTTTKGGISQAPCYDGEGCGVIFEMMPNRDGTWTYHILHRFAGYPTDGQIPYGGLIMDASGNFYGTTEGGGIYGYGTAFKLTFAEGHWKKTAVYDFPNLSNGLPGSTLVLDKAGNLYGAAGGGNQVCGPYTCGLIFKLTPQSNGTWKYSVVHKFSGPDGNFPWGVIVDSKGNIFGTTANGGTYNSGVVFEITP